MKRKSLPTGRDFLFVEGYGNENPGAFQSPRPLRGATAHPYIRGLIPAFQPTRPLRGATGVRRVCIRTTLISTHAPLAGRDRVLVSLVPITSNFNPRAPCGARLFPLYPLAHPDEFQPTRPLRGATAHPYIRGLIPAFQSTRPLRGATLLIIALVTAVEFQSTRPLRGATSSQQQKDHDKIYFNPRAPCGARPAAAESATGVDEFQSTRPLRGATAGNAF